MIFSPSDIDNTTFNHGEAMSEQRRDPPNWEDCVFFLVHLAVETPEVELQFGRTRPAELTAEEKMRPNDPDIRRHMLKLMLWKHFELGEFNP